MTVVPVYVVFVVVIGFAGALFHELVERNFGPIPGSISTAGLVPNFFLGLLGTGRHTAVFSPEPALIPT